MLRQELLHSFSAQRPHWKNNLTHLKDTELVALERDLDVRILATDKNLGPALVSTDWVRNEMLRHLHDQSSYSTVTQQDCGYVHHCNIISRIMPELSCTVCYKSTLTLASLQLQNKSPQQQAKT